MNYTEIPFNHPTEIHHLYENDLLIDHEILRQIIALPRKTLIQDLELILESTSLDLDIYEDESEKTSFVLHALFLLNHLNSNESLPKIIQFFEKHSDKDNIEFWLSDHKTETLWNVFFNLGLSNLDAVKNALFSEIEIFTKMGITNGIIQAVLHEKIDKQIVEPIFKELLTYFNSTSVELLDSDFVACVCSDVVEIKLESLYSIVKELYDRDIPNYGFNGSYENLMLEQNSNHIRKPYIDIFELYEHITSTWNDYLSYKEKTKHLKKIDEVFIKMLSENPVIKQKNNFIEYEPQMPLLKEYKISRNDPCSCGSGKKYKKCCGVDA